MVTKPLRDKTGREILPGDLLKVFHFTGARRKKHYMYKFVTGDTKIDGRTFMVCSHLSLGPKDVFYERRDGRILHEFEIVQGYAGGESFEDRPRDMEPMEDGL